MKKFKFNRPATAHETGELQLGLHFFQADKHSKTPGQFHLTANVLDEHNQVVQFFELQPETLERLGFTAPLEALREEIFSNMGVTVEEIEDPKPEAAKDVEP